MLRKIRNMKKMQKICVATLALFAVAPTVGCGCNQGNNDDVLKDVIHRENYQSVYDKIGKDITINEVREGTDGRAYVSVGGRE